MTKPDFSAIIGNLSAQERYVLGMIAINQDTNHDPEIIQKLVGLRLVISNSRKIGSHRIDRYCVPVAAHVAWCQWCSDCPDDELDAVSACDIGLCV